MKLRIRKLVGYWVVHFVYNEGTDEEYEVFMDKYLDWQEALSIAFYVVELEETV